MFSLLRASTLKQKLLARFGRAAQDERGISAVEFALILPIMISMYLGAVEFGHALTIDRRVTSVASSAADLAEGSSASRVPLRFRSAYKSTLGWPVSIPSNTMFSSKSANTKPVKVNVRSSTGG